MARSRAQACIVLLLGLAACTTPTAPPGLPPALSPVTATPVPTAPATTAAVTTGQAAAALTLGAEWPTYHRDAARSGAEPDGPDPVAAAVAWRATLDGAVHASPLIARGLVIAATETGSLYGLDAATGATVWRTHLADPVAAGDRPCGDIAPTVGVTGTPVYDAATGQVFAVTATPGGRHVLLGVDLLTGQIRTQRPVDAPGSDPGAQVQRGALLLSDGVVYVPFDGAGGCGAYVGRVVGVPIGHDAPLVAFAVPTPRRGGIGAPSGPVALPGGDLLVTTDDGAAATGGWDHSDALLRLSPALALRDGFAPAGWAQAGGVDADLGATGPVLLPGAHRVLAASRGGALFLTDVDRLGGVGGQLARLEGCRSAGGAAVAAGTGGDALVYLPCAEGLTQLVVGSDDQLTRGWRAAAVDGSPVLVGNTVWAVDRDGTLHGLQAADGAARAAVPVGGVARAATPAVSGTAIVVPTLTGVTAVATTR